MKKITAAVLLLFVAWMPIGGRAAESMTDEERAALVEHLNKNKDVIAFAGKGVNAVLGDPRLKASLEKISKYVLAIKIADKIADAKDWDAIALVGEYRVKEFLKAAFPDVDKALGWFMWAKKGMELFKEFVFDPWLFREQVETYIARRTEGMDPEDAFATLPGWGYTRERALKMMEKQGYNVKLLWVNGEKGKLSEVWERKLWSFINADFELQYQKKFMKEAADRARLKLADLDREIAALLSAAPPKKETPPAKVEKPLERRLFLESAEVTPKSGKIGEPFYLKMVYGIEGILPDEKLTGTSKLEVSGTKTLPFSEKAVEFDGAKASKGVVKNTIDASAAFGLPGDHSWIYNIRVLGFDPLKGSVHFSVEKKAPEGKAREMKGRKLAGQGRWNDGPYGGAVDVTVAFGDSGGGSWTAKFTGGGGSTTVTGQASGAVQGNESAGTIIGTIRYTVSTADAQPVTLSGSVNGSLKGSQIAGTWSSGDDAGSFTAAIR